MTDPANPPNVAFVSRYPSEKDLEEALGPPREPKTAHSVYPRVIFQVEDKLITGWPRKTTLLVARAQGTLNLETTLQTGKGDTVQISQELERSDALEIITALADWVASPDSVLRESPDGRLIEPEGR